VHESHIAAFAPFAEAPYLIAPRASRIGSDGDALAVFEYGNTDPAAPAILLVHGLAHWTQAAWDRLTALLDPTLRVVAFDLPGFGASDKPDVAYDAAVFLRAVERVVEARMPARFALCGHSLGGAIAAHYASIYPERISHLTLIAPAGFAVRPVYRILGSPIGGFILGFRPPKAIVDRVIHRSVVNRTSITPQEKAQTLAFTRDRAFRRAWARVYRSAWREFGRNDRLRDLARYSGPVLVAWGRHDAYVPIGMLGAVVAVYPQARIERFERSAHLPMIEEPQALAAAINAELTSRPSVPHRPDLQK
jgi:pimeloyl-ACP methyl ester carboxylesterase